MINNNLSIIFMLLFFFEIIIKNKNLIYVPKQLHVKYMKSVLLIYCYIF